MTSLRLSVMSLLVTCLATTLAAGVTASPAAAELCLEIGVLDYMLVKVVNNKVVCEELLSVADGVAKLWVLAQWLRNGAAITASTAVDATGEEKFENTENGAAFRCSALLEGTVGPSGAYEITKIFSLSGTEIKELDESGATGGLTCTTTKLCETAETWPVNLPYKIPLYRDGEGSGFGTVAEPNGTGGLPAYSISCKVLGIKVHELCEDAEESFGEVSNVASGVETVGSTKPPGKCGEKAGIALQTFEAGNIIKLVSGETLSTSA
jgi:hypothetical protein